MYIATKRLYVNRDYSKLVPEDSPEVAFLLATPGKPVETALARRLGLLGKAPVEAPPPAEPEPEPEPEPNDVLTPVGSRRRRGG